MASTSTTGVSVKWGGRQRQKENSKSWTLYDLGLAESRDPAIVDVVSLATLDIE